MTHRPALLTPEDRDLLAFWDFQGEGARHVAVGAAASALVEQRGPITRADGGIFGPRALRIAFGQWLRLPRAELGPLDIHGRQPFTMAAWVQRDSSRPWQFVAGVWNEHDHRRQYALFLNATKMYDHVADTRSPCADRAHAYLSATGGHTPGHPACFSYATGASVVPMGRWACVAMTYDGAELALWVNGRLDALPRHNPMPFRDGIFAGGADGADFTVAQRAMALWHDYPEGPMPADEGFTGLLGGLALWRRALNAAEHEALAALLPARSAGTAELDETFRRRSAARHDAP